MEQTSIMLHKRGVPLFASALPAFCWSNVSDLMTPVVVSA